MVQGDKKTGVTKGGIFSRVSGEEIFRKYMPWKFSLNSRTKNPFTRKDNSPSMVIGDKSDTGEVIFKCFNSPHKGGAIEFVMAMFGVEFHEALEKIAGDFNISPNDREYTPIITEGVKKYTKLPVIIQVKSKPFTQGHIEYLSNFHISPNSLDFCKDIKCVAIKEWALNRAKMPLKMDEVAFGYIWKEKWVKVYRPFANKREKWTSNIPFVEMMGLDNMEGCETGIITKSVKDAAFIKEHILPCVCCVQAEDISAVTQENIEYLNKNCKRIFVNFDGDKKGVESCQELTKATGWRYINPPKALLEQGVTDFTDMSKLLGVQAVIDFFKQKGVI